MSCYDADKGLKRQGQGLYIERFCVVNNYKNLNIMMEVKCISLLLILNSNFNLKIIPNESLIFLRYQTHQNFINCKQYIIFFYCIGTAKDRNPLFSRVSRYLKPGVFKTRVNL